jgi:predicted O-methyltransferase YrrM
MGKAFFPTAIWRVFRYAIWRFRGGAPPLLKPTAEQVVIREKLAALRDDHCPIQIRDFGAARGDGPPIQRNSTVARVARSASKASWQAERLAWWLERMEAKYVLELGSCLGTTTAVMAATSSRPLVVSLEGDPGLAMRSRWLIEDLNEDLNEELGDGPGATTDRPLRVEVVEGEFSKTLPEVVGRHRWDVVFIDGHHRSDALAAQIELIRPQLASTACVIIDDIYWSMDMFGGWCALRDDGFFSAAVDEFHHGVLLKGGTFAVQNKGDA